MKKQKRILRDRLEADLKSGLQLEQAEAETEKSQPASSISPKIMRQAIANPSAANPSAILSLQQTYGNQAVLRLLASRKAGQGLHRQEVVEKGQISRQVANHAPATIQRKKGGFGDVDWKEVEQKQAELSALKSQLQVAKAKRGTASAGMNLLELPARAIDQASIMDLHAKDAYMFAKTGKTRKERALKGSGKKLADFSMGKAKRSMGRTGLHGYLHGQKAHKIMYGDAMGDTNIPVLSSKYNPLTALGKVGAAEIKEIKDKITKLERELKKV